MKNDSEFYIYFVLGILYISWKKKLEKESKT